MSKRKLQNTIVHENGVAAACLNAERAKAATTRPLKAMRKCYQNVIVGENGVVMVCVNGESKSCDRRML